MVKVDTGTDSFLDKFFRTCRMQGGEGAINSYCNKPPPPLVSKCCETRGFFIKRIFSPFFSPAALITLYTTLYINMTLYNDVIILLPAAGEHFWGVYASASVFLKEINVLKAYFPKIFASGGRFLKY